MTVQRPNSSFRTGVPSPAHLIDGARDDGAGDRMDLRAASDQQVVASCPIADADVVDRAVRSARQALATSGWGRRAPRERARTLLRWADLVQAHAEEVAQLESVVSTRLIAEARLRDVVMVAEVLRYYAEWIDKTDGAVLSTGANELSFTLHEPWGVVAAIVPWNFPLILSSWKFAPALAAGNAVVLKPSELTPLSVVRVAELAIEAGLPAGIFNVVQGGGTTGAALVGHPDIAFVSFTGSTGTGRKIQQLAGETTKPVALELGGKGPQIVHADAASLDRVADLVLRGFCYNGGQVCFAGSRLVVDRRIKEDLVARLIARTATLVPGPTWEPATTLSPIITPVQLARIEDIVARSRAAGATVLAGGTALDIGTGGLFYAPTILDDTAPDSPACREEVFGPVLAVQTFDDEAEALALADHADYGLAASVHTQDIDKALRAARALQVGTVWINGFGRGTDHGSPFGGYKQSGIGKEMGADGYHKYLQQKSVRIETAAVA